MALYSSLKVCRICHHSQGKKCFFFFFKFIIWQHLNAIYSFPVPVGYVLKQNALFVIASFDIGANGALFSEYTDVIIVGSHLFNSRIIYQSALIKFGSQMGALYTENEDFLFQARYSSVSRYLIYKKYFH